MMRIYIVGFMLATWGTSAGAEGIFDPESPFREGEGMPETPATCTTAEKWVQREPKYDGRITFAIEGALSDVSEDGALAYLLMCEEGPMQVMCVTYHSHGRKSGDRVLMAGGYNNYDGSMIVLDPCMAWSEEQGEAADPVGE
jgi:hypothetical protein